MIDGYICKYFMGKNRHYGTEDPVNTFNPLETKENKTMGKAITMLLAPLVAVLLDGPNHAQLFIEEIETNQVDKGLWAKSFADQGGDENKAKALYIKRRVALLAEHRHREQQGL